ncbi:hypothetical protein LCGC14_1745740 [marine sediment metagenome]|uniref:THIF-type NAD/FAD binding fold domain-containing protein n=1 Tax=marine sediment metagenome TaxID=412755 RepID=A0A0F9H5C5_9ZZZZ
MIRPDEPTEAAPTRTVTVVGAGNIGSFLIPLLGRMGRIGHVTIIDRDVYEQKNLTVQDISGGDVGKPKAEVQARRLKRLFPWVEAEAIVASAADVPLGRYRSDLLLMCLDSKAARQDVHRPGYRLGMVMIDAGVNATAGMLARVTVYVPGPGSACLECGWSQRDYDALEQARPCLDGRIEATPTNSPSCLGALAASLQAIEAGKHLNGEAGGLSGGQEVVLDVQSQAHCVTALRPDPACRFDHQVWEIEPIRPGAGQITLGEAMDLGGADRLGGPATIELEGQPFVRTLQCTECGQVRLTLRLLGRLRLSDRRCRRCGRKMTPLGADMAGRLGRASVARRTLDKSLKSIGFEDGDVLTVMGRSGAAGHFELGGGPGRTRDGNCRQNGQKERHRDGRNL